MKPARGPLPPRLLQVAKLVAEGLANKEIGFRLHLEEGTIKEYMFTIFKKLGVSNRTEVALRMLSAPPAQPPRAVTPDAFPVHLL